jgi:hypothetical protein
LYFDVAFLSFDGVQIADGRQSSFAELGLAAGEPVVLHARELTVLGAPADRDLTLVADRLSVSSGALQFRDTGHLTRVEIWAEQITGALVVRSQGPTGPIGPEGARGEPAVVATKFERDPDDPEGKPRAVRVLKKAAGKGGPGGVGGPGGRGGTIRIRYVTAATTPRGEAPGGTGGPGGHGGRGGDGKGFGEGPRGLAGPQGPVGPPGEVTVTPFGSATDLWSSHAGWSGGLSLSWAAHRLAVAEYHYRLGTPDALATARTHLALLTDRPGTGLSQARARRLMQQLFEGTTFIGLPRDVDVTPDVGFAAQDVDKLYDSALQLLGIAATVAGTAIVQATIAASLRLAAQQGANTLTAAKARVDEANEHLRTAESSTDIAQGRVKAIEAKIDAIGKAISEASPDPSSLDIFKKVVGFTVAVGGVVAGVATGAGAAVALGEGFLALSETAGKAQTMSSLIDDVKGRLDRKDMSGFKTSLGDLTNTGKSIIHMGKMVGELSSIGSTHPNALLRDLALANREKVLLLKDVALHRQLEKEAQLGISASAAERDAVQANIGLSNDFASKLDHQVQVQAEPVLRTLLGAVRQLLDLLSVHVFRTLRAREIYLGLDPVTVIQHDLGHLHPDRERILPPVDQVREVIELVAPRRLQIIEWSSLVDQMEGNSELSQTPVPFWFATEDPAHLAVFRTTGQFGFGIPIEDLFEEDGSQIYEAKFDAATVVLHGARIAHGSGQSIKLRLLGRWSFRRRPDAANPAGQVVDYALPPREIHLDARQTADGVEANVLPPSNVQAQPPIAMWGRGIAGEWELADEGGIDLTGLTAVEVGFHTQALSRTGFRAAGARDSGRLLRPLAGGWPQPPAPARLPTPVPTRGWHTYTYAGGVTAVGAGLL